MARATFKIILGSLGAITGAGAAAASAGGDSGHPGVVDVVAGAAIIGVIGLGLGAVIDRARRRRTTRRATTPRRRGVVGAAAGMSGDLSNIIDLYERGLLTADEFAAAKARVLTGPAPEPACAAPPASAPATPIVSVAPTTSNAPRRHRRWLWVAGAVTVVVAAGIAAGVIAANRDDDTAPYVTSGGFYQSNDIKQPDHTPLIVDTFATGLDVCDDDTAAGTVANDGVNRAFVTVRVRLFAADSTLITEIKAAPVYVDPGHTASWQTPISFTGVDGCDAEVTVAWAEI